MSVPTDQAPRSADLDGLAEERRERQLHDLRFVEALQETLAGCRDLTAVYSSAVHRIAAAFPTRAVCLWLYEPVGDTLTPVHGTGQRVEWNIATLQAAVAAGRTQAGEDLLVVPIVSEGIIVDGPTALAKR